VPSIPTRRIGPPNQEIAKEKPAAAVAVRPLAAVSVYQRPPMDDIETTLRNYITRNILFSDGEYPYADDASFLETGVVDSLGVMELVMFVEERFGVDVEDREVVPANFDSVSRLSAYVRGKATPRA
jgi:acyl carrier protein